MCAKEVHLKAWPVLRPWVVGIQVRVSASDIAASIQLSKKPAVVSGTGARSGQPRPCPVMAFSLHPPAELPLTDLMKLYEGAFLPGFQWPQPSPDSDETSEDEGRLPRSTKFGSLSRGQSTQSEHHTSLFFSLGKEKMEVYIFNLELNKN